MLKFRFELTPLDEVRPWGATTPNLHWFALTDGRYCLSTGDIDLLRYSDNTGQEPPWADYYLARWWEDLLQVLPAALEPVPDDLIDFLTGPTTAWLDPDDLPGTDTTALDAAYPAHFDRHIDTGYLNFAPSLRLARTADDTVVLAWTADTDPTGEIAFTAPPAGRTTIGAAEFAAAVTELDHELMTAMRERIDRITATGPPRGVALDLAQLNAEHADRRTWLATATARQPDTDWDAVRTGAAALTRR